MHVYTHSILLETVAIHQLGPELGLRTWKLASPFGGTYRKSSCASNEGRPTFVLMHISNGPTLSYANPEDPWWKKQLIKGLESLTGQKKIQRIYEKLDDEQREGPAFWEAALQALDIRLDYDPRQLGKVPKSGPLILVANHPFGVLDGLIICYLATSARGEFRILTNSVLCQARELEAYLLPIDFQETREAIRTNIQTKQRAINTLQDGGTVVIFPAGGVSTANKVFGKAVDAEWKTFTARLVHEGQAQVVPIFFHGQNSRVFHWASQVSLSLRLSLLLHELKNKMGKRIPISIGDPIPYARMAGMRDRATLMEFLRQQTYGLGAS